MMRVCVCNFGFNFGVILAFTETRGIRAGADQAEGGDEGFCAHEDGMNGGVCVCNLCDVCGVYNCVICVVCV